MTAAFVPGPVLAAHGLAFGYRGKPVGRDVDLAVRCELGSVEDDSCTVPACDLGELRDRPELTGHIGRSGQHDETWTRWGSGQGRVQRNDSVARRRRGLDPAHPWPPPRQQGRVVLGVEQHHRSRLRE